MLAFINILNEPVFKLIIGVVFIGFLPRLLSPVNDNFISNILEM